MVDRAIRLDGGAAAVLSERPPARPAFGANDLRCSSCDAVVCEAARVRLFAGIVLQCAACGHSVRVPR